MLIVAALGGKSLERRGDAIDAGTRRRDVAKAIDVLAQLARKHRMVVTHGNGLQVALDMPGSELEGMPGSVLEQALTNRLPGEPGAAELLTQVVVDAGDPAFQHPNQPIGPVYSRATGERLAREHGWSMASDGEHWRRVLASPEPQHIVELETIRTLVDAGVLVICVGANPVVVDEHGALSGVEAVIDADHSAAVLARELGADVLLLLTDVPCAERNYGTELAHPIHEASPSELDLAEFADGSMRPKIEAASRFASQTGAIAAIGALADAPAILAGRAGTRIVSDGTGSQIDSEHGLKRLGQRAQDLDKDIHKARLELDRAAALKWS